MHLAAAGTDLAQQRHGSDTTAIRSMQKLLLDAALTSGSSSQDLSCHIHGTPAVLAVHCGGHAAALMLHGSYCWQPSHLL